MGVWLTTLLCFRFPAVFCYTMLMRPKAETIWWFQMVHSCKPVALRSFKCHYNYILHYLPCRCQSVRWESWEHTNHTSPSQGHQTCPKASRYYIRPLSHFLCSHLFIYFLLYHIVHCVCNSFSFYGPTVVTIYLLLTASCNFIDNRTKSLQLYQLITIGPDPACISSIFGASACQF